MLALAEGVKISLHPLAVRITTVVVFFLLLSLLLWRRGHRG
jgi:hypothetical protein